MAPAPQENDATCEPIAKKIKIEATADWEPMVKLEVGESSDAQQLAATKPVSPVTSDSDVTQPPMTSSVATVEEKLDSVGLPADSQKPFSVQVLGQEVQFRRLGKVVLFQTASVLELCRRQLPILSRMTSRQLQLAGGGGSSSSSCPGKAFISLEAWSQLTTGWLTELALLDLLRNYRLIYILKISVLCRVADPDLFGRIRKIFNGSGSYRYFGNVKLYKQRKNILKIEVLHIFR